MQGVMQYAQSSPLRKRLCYSVGGRSRGVGNWVGVNGVSQSAGRLEAPFYEPGQRLTGNVMQNLHDFMRQIFARDRTRWTYAGW